MQELMLDAASPPVPLQWIGDMDAVGASGGMVYVLGPFTNYTIQHVNVARSRSKAVMPIVVPGNTPPTYATVWSALLNYGFTSGPVVIDLEKFSEPPDDWVRGAADFLNPLGYIVDRYGTASELGKYSPENADWVAEWIRTGTLDPLPSLPAGSIAWQFVNDVVINGRQYDASVVDQSFLQGVVTDMFTYDEKLALVHRWYMTYLGRWPESQEAMDGWAKQIADDRSNVREVQDAFATSDEGKAWAAKLAAIRAGDLGSATLVAHEHSTPSGTTGPAQAS